MANPEISVDALLPAEMAAEQRLSVFARPA